MDGVILDWSTLFSATKEVSVAAANNHDRLVIALATSDAKVKQRLLAAGVIVYLDPSRKVIGLGVVTPEVPSQGRGQPGEGGAGGRAGRSGGRGGMGGMGGGMGRGGSPPGGAQGKELKVWTSIELAPRSPY